VWIKTLHLLYIKDYTRNNLPLPVAILLLIQYTHTRAQGYYYKRRHVRERILLNLLSWKGCKFCFHIRPDFIFSVKQKHVATIFIIVTCVNRNTSSIIHKKHDENLPLQVTILLLNDAIHASAQGRHNKWHHVRGRILLKLLQWTRCNFCLIFDLIVSSV